MALLKKQPSGLRVVDSQSMTLWVQPLQGLVELLFPVGHYALLLILVVQHWSLLSVSPKGSLAEILKRMGWVVG